MSPATRLDSTEAAERVRRTSEKTAVAITEQKPNSSSNTYINLKYLMSCTSTIKRGVLKGGCAVCDIWKRELEALESITNEAGVGHEAILELDKNDRSMGWKDRERRENTPVRKSLRTKVLGTEKTR